MTDTRGTLLGVQGYRIEPVGWSPGMYDGAMLGTFDLGVTCCGKVTGIFFISFRGQKRAHYG